MSKPITITITPPPANADHASPYAPYIVVALAATFCGIFTAIIASVLAERLPAIANRWRMLIATTISAMPIILLPALALGFLEGVA